MWILLLVLCQAPEAKKAAAGKVVLAPGVKAVIVDGEAAISENVMGYARLKVALRTRNRNELKSLKDSGQRVEVESGTVVEVVQVFGEPVEVKLPEGPPWFSKKVVTGQDNLRVGEGPGAGKKAKEKSAAPKVDRTYVPKAGEEAVVVVESALLYETAAALKSAASEGARKAARGTEVRVEKVHGRVAVGSSSPDAALEVTVLKGEHADQRLFAKPRDVGRFVDQGEVAAEEGGDEVPAAVTEKVVDTKRLKSQLAQAKALEKANKAAAVKKYQEIIDAAPESAEGAEAKKRLEALGEGGA